MNLQITSRTKTILLLSLVVFSLPIAFFSLDSKTTFFTKEGDFEKEEFSDCVEVQILQPVWLYGLLVNNKLVIQNQVKKNQFFFDLFNTVRLSEEVRMQLHTLPKRVFDFRKIGAHKKYTLICENDSLRTAHALIYEPNAIDYVIFYLKDSLQVETCQREVSMVEKTISGTITSSLSETIKELNISHELTNKFVDIFGWQVDFQRLQKGDRFKLIYQENLVEKKPVNIGKILGIYFEHFDKGYYAFPFDQGEGLDYFDAEGKSLRKALLKYPIEFTRISSRYNLNRFHPVAKVFRAHLGTDFAAPQGTPIRSVGEGTVEDAKYTANNGNYVKIRHNGTYTTAYLHMSKIASSVVAGTRVKQGQTIGYVGSTGLATGPHLCYRFWRNGVQVDALRIELPPSKPVKQDHLATFEKVKEQYTNRLKLIPFSPTHTETVIAGN